MTPTLSVAAVQVRLAWPAPPVALRVGVLGGVVSATVAVAVLLSGPMLPAASSAVSL